MELVRHYTLETMGESFAPRVADIVPIVVPVSNPYRILGPTLGTDAELFKKL